MPFYQKVLDDRVVAITSATSPGRGWTAVSDFPTLVTNARTRDLPLHLRPGTYPSGPIDVTQSTGSGNPLTMTAELGTVTIQLSGNAPYLFKDQNVNNVDISNIIFDGNNIALTDTSPTAGLLRFSGTSIRTFAVRHCDIKNSVQAGISCDAGARGNISENRIYNCDSGIFNIDCLVYIERNWIRNCSNNGIQVWTSTVSRNNSQISRNYVDTIVNTRGGAGQYGNGIVVFRASNVRISENTVGNCTYAAIRLNGSGNALVLGNYCYNLRETAIFVEAPMSGLNLDGGIVANNIVRAAGSGIHVVNSGLYNDGVSRRVTVTGNQVIELNRTYVPEERATTAAIGILVEGSCNVVANSIENAAGAGIVLGTNNASTDLTASGNSIHSCPMGIGYSANGSAASTLISGNLISNYKSASDPADPHYAHSGAIVSVSFDGSDYKRDSPDGVANADYGNSPQTTVGALTVGMNRAR